jgi:hypothetical protein
MNTTNIRECLFDKEAEADYTKVLLVSETDSLKSLFDETVHHIESTGTCILRATESEIEKCCIVSQIVKERPGCQIFSVTLLYLDKKDDDKVRKNIQRE